MDTENKRGPWSSKEKDFIQENANKLTADQIGQQLHRNSKAIEKYLKDNKLISTGNKLTPTTKMDYDLKRTPHWKQLKKQFDDEELDLILYHWNNTIQQFRDDVLHTEELQIIDMVKLEVLMNRKLSDERSMKSSIQSLEALLEQEESKGQGLQDTDLIMNYTRQISALYASMESVNKEYRELGKEKIKILDKLKGTREQRIKEIQSGKENMSAWIRMIIKRPALRKKLGMDMEKMRLAMEVEFERLSEYHKYDDGALDQPFLTPENTKGGE